MNPCLNFFFFVFCFLSSQKGGFCMVSWAALDEFVERNGGKKATVIKLVFDFWRASAIPAKFLGDLQVEQRSICFFLSFFGFPIW